MLMLILLRDMKLIQDIPDIIIILTAHILYFGMGGITMAIGVGIGIADLVFMADGVLPLTLVAMDSIIGMPQEVGDIKVVGDTKVVVVVDMEDVGNE